MDLLAEIDDQECGIPSAAEQSSRDAFRERKAARTILFDKDGRIALMHVSKYGYHKLPGGGVEDGENWKEAAIREALEETGCIVALRSQEVGQIIEWRAAFKIKQISYCVVADVVENTEHITLTQEEECDGLKVKWVEFSHAIELLSNDKPQDYMGQFIQKRDLIFLNKALEYPI